MKVKWQLTADPAEISALRSMLAGCPTGPSNSAVEPLPTTTPPTTATAAPTAGPVTFQNCAEAEAAGAAPINRGEPGYSSKLDRDGDGVACEG